ncbi:MAG: ATPase domain-containing protein, partial [Phycisphaerae bacterium]
MARTDVTDAADDDAHDVPPLSTGVPGVNDILRGGFTPDCLYLVTGTPGSGKTTFAIQFLLEGVRAGERCLYVTLSESRREIAKV